jgi:hypothetical protein
MAHVALIGASGRAGWATMRRALSSRPARRLRFSDPAMRSSMRVEHSLGHQRRVSSRRRAHRREHAALARICRGRGAPAHVDHHLGSPVRPYGYPHASGGRGPAGLIIGGAGGVSSIAIQLVRTLTDQRAGLIRRQPRRARAMDFVQ